MKPWLKKERNDEVVEVMGAKIVLKALSYGKAREAVALAMKLDMQSGQMDMDATLLAALRALYQIKEWDLTDEKDKPIPVTLKQLDDMDPDFVNELVKVIGEVGQPTVDALEKKQ